MAAPLILYLNTTGKSLVGNFTSAVQPFSGIVLEAGDLVPVQLHFLQVNTAAGTAGQLPYSYIDPATVTPVSLAIGVVGAMPSGGTFTVAFNTSTSAALAYNVSASALQTAINGLSGIPAGGVTVVGNAGGPYTVTFNTAGALSYELVINASELVPVSQGLTSIAIAGAAGVQEQEVLTLLQSPAALQTTWTSTYGAITVSELQAGGSGINEIQRVTIPQGTYGGAYALTFGAKSTGSIAYNATAAQVQTALQGLSSIGAGNCTVIASSTVTWDVTFTGSLAGASQSLITASGTGLQMPMYLAGSVNLNVQGIFNLVSGQTAASATLQIQQGNSGSVNTVLQATVTVNPTLIQGTPSVPNAANPWQTLSQVNALITAAAYTLPTASTSVLGGVKVDGATIAIASGVISARTGTSSVLGVLQTDGVTISNTSGVISVTNRNTRVTTNFAVTSNATLANVTGLTQTLAASGTYGFECVLFTTATSGGGVQAAIGGTCTATSIEYEGELTSAAAVVAQTRSTALGGAVCSSTTTTAGTIWITGAIAVNAGGTLTVQFAQNASNGSASTVLANSWFKVWATSN